MMLHCMKDSRFLIKKVAFNDYSIIIQKDGIKSNIMSVNKFRDNVVYYRPIG